MAVPKEEISSSKKTEEGEISLSAPSIGKM